MPTLVKKICMVIWHGMTWYGTVCGVRYFHIAQTVWCMVPKDDMVRYGMVWYGTIGILWYCRYGSEWHGMVLNGSVWHLMVW